ncbi:hypothetical protein [Devosia nitrariae]|uniref:Uncharacterized protein n=1 Tax=Devosia nitrariae TaxID=2071872 RepID=A0ABQ5W4D0_9HYPH|nr:hypothetical protein [Devosia nitrariae]GLQ54671.1 hypothetical protein GCM10010862_19300 [Devosia nitrariae]
MERPSHAIALTVWLLVGCLAATADSLVLPGTYGNADGCTYLATGDLTGDALRYLTSEEVASYGSGCRFVAVHADGAGNQLAQGICSYEGEEFLGAEDYVITPPDADGRVRVYTAAGELWDELEPCS